MTPGPSRREALRLLGLQDPVVQAEVVAAYRRLARQHHPDLGGDPEVFRSLTAARDLLLAQPDGRSGAAAGRSVTVRRRPGRRVLRGLRRLLGRKGGRRRHLD